MTIKMYPKKQKKSGYHAQAMVEFAIVMPLLLALLIGILEFGRMVFIYTAATNASREAVRFASAIGFSDTTYYRKYQYCSAIRDVAKRYGFLLNLQDSDIAIAYDHGPGTTAITNKCAPGMINDPTIVIVMGSDRVKVTVTANYSPMVRFLPISSRAFVSSSSRTIAGNVKTYP
jgi:Flp pilus assembly protein TadG